MDELVQSSITFAETPSISRWNTGRYFAVRVMSETTGDEKSHFPSVVNQPRNALPSTDGAEICVTALPEGTETERRVPESPTKVTVTEVPSPPITFCSQTANSVSIFDFCPSSRERTIFCPGSY